jgi:hypothetical protein
MNTLFYDCVYLLKEVAKFFDITYEEANIWIFVIIHPLITIFFIVTTILLTLKIKKLRRRL